MRLALLASSLIVACGGDHTTASDAPIGPGDTSALTDASAPGGYVHAGSSATGPSIVDGTGAPLELRCVNLGAWLEPEPYMYAANALAFLHGPRDVRASLVQLVGASAAAAFWQTWEATFVTEADFTRIAALGFNCVRLPIDAKEVGIVSGTTVTLSTTELAAVDNAVAWGGAHGVYVVIDMHDAFGGANFIATSGDVPSADLFPQLWVGSNGEYPSATAAANQQLMAALWGELAARYANATAMAGFDLINEPELNIAAKPSQSPVPQSDLVAYEASATAAIRAVDSHHMIFVEGDSLATDFTPFTAPLDPNSTYEFHAYAGGSNSPWTDPAEPALDPLLAMETAQGVPLWLGEFGENTLAWDQEMIALVAAKGIGRAVWSWKQRSITSADPVVETITLPTSWAPVASYLVGATTTAPADPAQGMTDLLAAVALANCTEDTAAATALSAP
jgi:endoglucanase